MKRTYFERLLLKWATALAFDLHRTGRQAIDLGHLVNCYHEFLGEKLSPESLPFRADHPNRPQA